VSTKIYVRPEVIASNRERGERNPTIVVEHEDGSATHVHHVDVVFNGKLVASLVYSPTSKAPSPSVWLEIPRGAQILPQRRAQALRALDAPRGRCCGKRSDPA
jgi:hypothetical protein